jgi:hypothetical protein
MNQLEELRWSVQNLQIQGDLNRLLQTIEDGTAYSGTDGYYKDGYGTAAFRIQNDLGDQITGCNITPGLQDQQSACRSELRGIVGILVLLDLLQQHCDLRIHQFVITCDCNGAGLKSLTYQQPSTANNDNYDLLTQAMKFMYGRARNFNQPLAEWNVANVGDMTAMSADASVLNQNLCAWEDKTQSLVGYIVNA